MVEWRHARVELMPHPVCSEVLRRFPELADRLRDGDEDLPYLVMGELAGWLASAITDGVSPELAERVSAFNAWCTSQPSRDTAKEDTFTILVVGLYEKLMADPAAHPLVPLLVPRAHFEANFEYLSRWIDAEALELLRARYAETADRKAGARPNGETRRPEAN